MAGGQGIRLWPYSRKEKPKQFLDFMGMGRSLFQLTYERVLPLFDPNHIYVLTNKDYVELIKQQLPNLPAENILPEPVHRNTAPAAAWAAMHLSCKDPDANMVALPVDQLIQNEVEFRNTLLRGLEFAATHHKLVTVGKKPTQVETAYGYIQIDEEMGDGIYTVKSFTEKPELEFANLFVECGEFYWNTGMFIWNVKTLIDEIHDHIPELADKLGSVAWHIAQEKSQDWESQVWEGYSSCPNLSIDYGILEKSDDVCVIIGNFGWADLGSWQSYYDLAPKDTADNAAGRNHLITYNSKGNLVALPEGQLAVIEDLEGYAVIEAGNVLVVCPLEKTPTVLRKYVNDVKIKMGDEFV